MLLAAATARLCALGSHHIGTRPAGCNCYCCMVRTTWFEQKLFGRREERLVYYRIANHYKFIMQQLFGCRQYERLIIVEDDMLFAPDFFPYFEATSKILDQAPTPYVFAALLLTTAAKHIQCCRNSSC